MPMEKYLMNPYKFQELIDYRILHNLIDDTSNLFNKPVVVLVSTSWKD
jgi:hypothetical protein